MGSHGSAQVFAKSSMGLAEDREMATGRGMAKGREMAKDQEMAKDLAEEPGRCSEGSQIHRCPSYRKHTFYSHRGRQ